VLLIEGTPLTFEVEDIEVSIFRHQVDESGLQVAHTVRKRAVFPIVAFVNILAEVSAEFGLVLLNVVKPFHSVMSIWTVILLGTVVSLRLITQISFTLPHFSTFVFDSVIESAMLVVMLVGQIARLNLELIQVQVLDQVCSSARVFVGLHDFKDTV
jgi:hypothetical protein